MMECRDYGQWKDLISDQDEDRIASDRMHVSKQQKTTDRAWMWPLQVNSKCCSRSASNNSNEALCGTTWQGSPRQLSMKTAITRS